MQYAPLGRSGLRVSPLCLGTMMFGGQTDEPEAARIIAKAAEQGVNFIDTADAYNAGRSEEIIGRAIKDNRHNWVVATKVAFPMGKGLHQQGLSRKWISLAVEGSLRRLGTDSIDIYYLHREEHDTPLTETVRTIADLVRQGKIRYFGLSNYRSWRVAEICRLCDDIGIDRPVVSSPYYNALNRMPEVEHLPACGYFGLGVVPYSPIARGVLTGKYEPDKPAPEGTRAARNDVRIMQAEWRPESLRIAQEIKRHAQARGITTGQFAVAWVLNNKFITSVIGGPRTEEQWSEYLGGTTYAFTAEDEAFIDSLVPPGHPSTPGYSDPAYPLEGRVPRQRGG
ncbi:MAG: aldo/keto reductase [Pseudomonadota bacterium]